MVLPWSLEQEDVRWFGILRSRIQLPHRVFTKLLWRRACSSDAESKKLAKYSELIQNHVFVPFAVETLGAWGASAWSLSSEIGARLSRKTGDPRATAFLRQNIDVAIQRGNAASILGTLHWRFCYFLDCFYNRRFMRASHYYFAIRIFFRLLTFIGLHNVGILRLS